MARRKRNNPLDEYSDYYDEDYSPEGRRKRKKKPPKDPGEKLQLPPAFKHLAVLSAIGLSLLGLVWMTAGWPMLEGTLKALIAPLGLIWIGLFLTVYFCLLRRQGFAAFVAFACWLLVTMSGNALVSNFLADSLQNEYVDFDLEKMERLDVMLVLGGGQTTTPSGNAQVTSAGDRAVLAARILLADKADRVICCGTSNLPITDDELAQGKALEQILISLGVPEEKILRIGGRNTKEEIQKFDQWITDNNAGSAKKGILTSAWHLPRAMRLAETVGIEATPIPADFMNTRFNQSPNLLIPGSGQLSNVTRCLTEYLGGLVGR